MINWIKADIYRLLHKKNLYIMMIIGLLLYFAAVCLVDDLEYFTQIATFIFSVNTFLIGIPIFLNVYSDSFKAKVMQITIGLGVPRWQVVLAKISIASIFCLIINLFFALVFIITTAIIYPAGLDVVAILMTALIDAFKIIVYLALSMIIVYLSQKPIHGMIIYIMAISNIFYGLLNLVLNIPYVVDIIGNRSDLLLTNAFSLVEFNYGDLFGWSIILVYLVVALGLSITLFKNVELDF